MRNFLIGFALGVSLLIAGCNGPQIAYYLYSKDRKEFEGVDASGKADVISIDDVRADKLTCTTLEGWQIQENWENQHCH